MEQESRPAYAARHLVAALDTGLVFEETDQSGRLVIVVPPPCRR
jgi:hypothetical protein